MNAYEKLKKFFEVNKTKTVERNVTIEKTHRQKRSMTSAANFKFISSVSVFFSFKSIKPTVESFLILSSLAKYPQMILLIFHIYRVR